MRQLLAKTSSDVIGGLICLAIGVFVIVEATGYRMGRLHDMGPGYFPVLLGALLCLMGILLIGMGKQEKPLDMLAVGTPRGMILLGCAFLAFALLIERVGLVPSAFLTTFLASQSDDRVDVLSGGVLAFVTAFGAFLIFNLLLGIQIEAFKL